MGTSAQRFLEAACVLILLVLVGLRPMVAESYDSAGNSISNALQAIENASPVRTLAFDAAVLVAGCLWLTSRAVGTRRAYRRTGLEAGALLMALAVIGSCVMAGNRRLAINGGVDWLCCLLMAVLLVQVLTTPLRRGLLLAVILASSAAQALECAEQRFASLSETWTEYERMKEEFWAQQGVPLDSPRVELFEQRLKSAEATGFLSHSNVAGSYLLVCGLAALGLGIARLRSSPERRGGAPREVSPRAALTVLLGVAVLGAIVLTGSRGAMAAVSVAAAVWGTMHLARRWKARRSNMTLVALWLVALLSVGGVLLLARVSTSGSSLNFRWQYWAASARMIADHPLFGVGAENFGRHYTRYKTIDSAEEIANPHNLLVQAAASWGAPGLVGMMLLFAGTTRRLILGPDAALAGDAATAPPDAGAVSGGPVLLWAVPLAGAILALRAMLLGTSEPNYLYYATATSGAVWLAAFAIALPGREGSPGLAPSVRAAVLAGLAAFLVHDLINFALFVPGSAVSFFALLAIVLSQQPEGQYIEPSAAARDATSRGGMRRFAAAGAAVLATAAFLTLFVLPVSNARSWMRAAATSPRPMPSVEAELDRADACLREAAKADPLDPTPFLRLAEHWAAASGLPEIRKAALDRAIEAAGQASRRDPHQGSLHRLAARLHLARQGDGDLQADLCEARRHAQEALHAYPSDPQAWILRAECALRLGQQTGDRTLLEECSSACATALALDAARPEWEIIRRLTPTERAHIDTLDRQARDAINVEAQTSHDGRGSNEALTNAPRPEAP